MDRKILKSHYQHIIIGGGIVGAGIFRDLSLHGQEVLIIDKYDFSSQTSAASSKMLHGGIRYLEQYDFELVHEALIEKNIWIRLTPHLAKEVPFYLPTFKDSKYPLWMTSIGLKIYDLLSKYQNSPHRVLGKKETLKHIPGLKEHGLKGAGLYYDGIIDDHKLGLECIYDGLESNNAYAENYMEVTQVISKDKIHFLKIKDNLTNEVYETSTSELIFATGPFTDHLMNKLNLPWQNKLVPTKGSHIWLNKDSLKLTKPMVLQTKDSRVIFLIPQRDAILVGTTEVAIEDDQNLFNLTITSKELHYLLAEIKNYFPNSQISEEDVQSSFAGIRPLIKEPGENSHNTSRKHGLFHPRTNMHVILGGKYTTFRVMAQDIVSHIFRKNNISYNNQLTLRPLRRTSVVGDISKESLTDSKLEQIVKTELVKTFEDLSLRRLSLIDDNSEHEKLLLKYKSLKSVRKPHK